MQLFKNTFYSLTANTLVGVPAETYGFGIHYGLIGIGYAMCGPLIALTIIPVLYPLNIISAHQYLQDRSVFTFDKQK